MPWFGSDFTRTDGTYTGASVWQDNAAAAINIVDTRHDTHDEDLADGINACINKNGQNTPTADLPMGTFKHTNVGNATARNQYVTMGQSQDGGGVYGGSSTGAANVYAINLSPAIPAYTDGSEFSFKAHQANTGAATLNINSLGAVAIVRQNGAALTGGEINNGGIIEVRYNSTTNQFVLQNNYIETSNGTALSVFGVTGNAAAPRADIVATSGGQVLRRSGNVVAFGAVDLAAPAAITGVLPVANGGTGGTLPIANGGTGQTTANAAFTALAAAGGTMAGTFAGTPTFSGATVFSGGPNITTTALNLTVGQIAFPAAQNASTGANTLDDYEEGLTNGSWTPSFTFGGGSVGQTYSRQRGFYIKIGRLVVAQFYVGFSNKGTSTGNASLAGLPFTQQSQTDYWGTGGSSFFAGFDAAVTSLHLIGNTNTTTAEIYRQNGGASARMTDAGFTNTSEIIGQIIYLASA